MNRLIFLDVDGVFNSDAYVSSDYYQQQTAGLSDAYIMLIAHHLHIDPKAVALMNDLVKRSGADVILSSTWRGKYTPTIMTDLFKDRGGDFTVAASTPILHGKVNSSRIPRGKEIAAYLVGLEVQPDAFVIIDDNDDMLSLKKFLVKTNKKFGLTADDVDKALKILNGDLT